MLAYHCNKSGTYKRRIANAFTRDALQYDTAASLQAEIGKQLLVHLALTGPPPHYILDLGCGTGQFTKIMDKRFTDAVIMGMDLSYGMLQVALQDPFANKKSFYGICGDAEDIPLKSHSIELIASNMMLQWCVDLKAVLTEIKRVLTTEGVLLFSILGNNALTELRDCWQGIDAYQHVHQFIDLVGLLNALKAAGFTRIHYQQKIIKTFFENIEPLLASLKKIGASNASPARRKGLMSKTCLQQLSTQYETLRNEQGLLPLSYEVIYIQAS